MTDQQRAVWAAIADLYTWEVETRERLPTYAARIAEIERAGGVVDLETGEVFYPKEEERERILERIATTDEAENHKG